MTPSQYIKRNREEVAAKQRANDDVYAQTEKKKADEKAQELNGYAGYNRFSVRETLINGRYTIYDSLTGASYNYGAIASMPALFKLTNDLKKEAQQKQVDAVSSASGKAKRRTSMRHFDFDEKPALEDIAHYKENEKLFNQSLGTLNPATVDAGRKWLTLPLGYLND